MGRYTTVQTYTDQDAKVAAISYSSATTGHADATNQVAAGANASSDGNTAATDAKFRMNRVDNVSGSSAGAGSGDFHMYRAARRREMERISRIEKEYEERKKQEQFQRKKQQTQTEFEARTKKKADRRRKRKANAKAKADADDSQAHSAPEAPCDTPRAAKQVRLTTTKEHDTTVLPETPGGVAEIPNDGTFLQTMLSKTATAATTTRVQTTDNKKPSNARKTSIDGY